MKRPRMLLTTLRLSNRDPVADALEVFDGNTASGVFGFRNKHLGDSVVFIRNKTRLFATTVWGFRA